VAALISRIHRWRLPAAALLALACMVGAARADDDALTQQRRIEAAYLYKFAGYLTWPDNAFPGPNSPILIGVDGDDSMADALAGMVEGRSVNGRPIQVRHIHPGDSVRGLHLLFVTAGAPQGDAAIAAASGNPTLAVTEGPDGLRRGANASFVLVDDRVRFDISVDPDTLGGVKVSALLLSVAHSVSGERP
jgi:hypothetical protein